MTNSPKLNGRVVVIENIKDIPTYRRKVDTEGNDSLKDIRDGMKNNFGNLRSQVNKDLAPIQSRNEGIHELNASFKDLSRIESI